MARSVYSMQRRLSWPCAPSAFTGQRGMHLPQVPCVKCRQYSWWSRKGRALGGSLAPAITEPVRWAFPTGVISPSQSPNVPSPAA